MTGANLGEVVEKSSAAEQEKQIITCVRMCALQCNIDDYVFQDVTIARLGRSLGAVWS